MFSNFCIFVLFVGVGMLWIVLILFGFICKLLLVVMCLINDIFVCLSVSFLMLSLSL